MTYTSSNSYYYIHIQLNVVGGGLKVGLPVYFIVICLLGHSLTLSMLMSLHIGYSPWAMLLNAVHLMLRK